MDTPTQQPQQPVTPPSTPGTPPPPPSQPLVSPEDPATPDHSSAPMSPGGSNPPQMPGTPPPAHPPASSLPLIIGGLVIGVLVMVVGAYLFTSANKPAAPTETMQPTAPVEVSPTVDPAANTTDVQIEEDTKAIDESLDSLSSEGATIEQSMQDQPDTLAQ